MLDCFVYSENVIIVDRFVMGYLVLMLGSMKIGLRRMIVKIGMSFGVVVLLMMVVVELMEVNMVFF